MPPRRAPAVPCRPLNTIPYLFHSDWVRELYSALPPTIVRDASCTDSDTDLDEEELDADPAAQYHAIIYIDSPHLPGICTYFPDKKPGPHCRDGDRKPVPDDYCLSYQDSLKHADGKYVQRVHAIRYIYIYIYMCCIRFCL